MSFHDLGRRMLSVDRYWLAPTMVLRFAVAVAISCGLAVVSPKLTLLALLGTPLVFLPWTLTQRRVVACRVRGDTLVMLGAPSVALRDITAGYISQESGPPAVTLELRNRATLRFSALDLDDARAMLVALGQDPAQRRTRFRHKRIFYQVLAVLVGPLAAFFVMAFVYRVLLGMDHLAPVAWNMVVGMGVGMVCSLALRRVLFPRLDLTVGRDGLWDRAHLRPRFVPWSEIAFVREDDTAVVLELTNGETYRLWCDTDDAWIRTAIHARITEGLTEFRAPRDTGDPMTALARGGRPYCVWRNHLRALGARPTDYRHQALERHRLEALVTDPSATPEQRIAAALTLSASEQGRDRIRVAAEALVEPTERAALEAIADERDAEADVEAVLRRG